MRLIAEIIHTKDSMPPRDFLATLLYDKIRVDLTDKMLEQIAPVSLVEAEKFEIKGKAELFVFTKEQLNQLIQETYNQAKHGYPPAIII